MSCRAFFLVLAFFTLPSLSEGALPQPAPGMVLVRVGSKAEVSEVSPQDPTAMKLTKVQVDPDGVMEDSENVNTLASEEEAPFHMRGKEKSDTAIHPRDAPPGQAGIMLQVGLDGDSEDVQQKKNKEQEDDSRTKGGVLSEADQEDEEAEDGDFQVKVPLAHTLRSELSRQQFLSSLEYDSDDGDEDIREFDLELGREFDSDDGDEDIREFDLEFVEKQGNAEDAFHKYADSMGFSEPSDVSFSPAVWNSAPEVRASHNCYMYALNDLSPRSSAQCNQTRIHLEEGRHLRCKHHFHKPGYYFQNFVEGRSETDVWRRSETSCGLMLPLIAADSPAIVWTNQSNMRLVETDDCPNSHYMAALFIHPSAGWHFYRRDHNCDGEEGKLCWSHKPGINPATDKDASGLPIRSVLQADRNYGELHYSEHCAFFCVPQNSHARTHSDSRRLPPRTHHGQMWSKSYLSASYILHEVMPSHFKGSDGPDRESVAADRL